MGQLIRLLIPFLFVLVLVFIPLLLMGETLAQNIGNTLVALDGHAYSKIAGVVDINSASDDQLRTLIGIGEVYAKRIVDGRPYQSTEDLVTRRIIPQTTYGKIQFQIIVKSR